MSQNKLSRWAVIVAVIVASIWRVNYHHNNDQNGYNATSWDALGYYIYLPSTFIYNDYKNLDWFPELDEKYNLTGGTFYQATVTEDSTYVFKYLGGTAIMQSPFFVIGHLIAKITDAPKDGFSAPYQYAIIWGAIFWFFIGLFFLRKVLLTYYDDRTTMITILLIVLSTNLLQYISIDGAMSHAYIFPMYAILLWWTIQWHKKPSLFGAFKVGFIIGLATISRPTELIMIFIPILWWLPSDKVQIVEFVKKYKYHILIILSGGIVGIFPQLLYWKIASGNWIHNVGSKWYFLNPWWRVLFGFEKGWFIYTPITVFMILGFFFIKNKVFRYSVITFCLLNIWIIIAWSDWRYGATYSTRALTHSYPVFALPMAGLIRWVETQKLKWIFYIIAIYLTLVNQFQIWQYNAGILHYDDMNRKYYSAIYLNPSPSPQDYSLMDGGAIAPTNTKWVSIEKKSLHKMNLAPYEIKHIVSVDIEMDQWIQLKASVNIEKNIHFGTWRYQYYKNGVSYFNKNFRMALPQAEKQNVVSYQHELFIDSETDSIVISIRTIGPLKIHKGTIELSKSNP